MTDQSPTIAVIIPAAGIGSRMQNKRPKQFLPLNGVPVIVHTCLAFLAFDTIQCIVIACNEAYQEETKQLINTHLQAKDQNRVLYTVGGEHRQDSVAAGLAMLPRHIEMVMVHDAARPLIDRETILRVMNKAMQAQAVIAALPAKDTLKLVAGDKITDTVDRSSIWMAQTPQAAGRGLLMEAFAHASETDFHGTDEASILEHFGVRVQVVEGSEYNLKITQPEDLQLAEKLLHGIESMKIGHGYDAHRLVEDRKLILGGVEIDSQLGLEGHSDADVVCHALCDAILGALGSGDIGRHFPDNDDQYKGISSLLLLERVIGLAHDQGLKIANADLTILCQHPKLAPYLPKMTKNIASCCRVETTEINIKATTTEKMGFVGREEGIAVHAVALLRG